jgi:hypothetical protein
VGGGDVVTVVRIELVAEGWKVGAFATGTNNILNSTP